MPQNQDYIVHFPDGTSKTYPAGTNMEDPQIKAELSKEFLARQPSQRGPRIDQQGFQPFQSPGPKVEAPGQESGNFGETAGDMMSFLGGLVPAPQVRYPLVSAGGALRAYSRGESPLAGAGKEAAMEGVFGTLGKVIPRAASYVANVTGGASRNIRNMGEVVDAQMRERTRQQAKPFGRAIPPGAEKRLEATKAAAGKELEKFETSRTATKVPISGYQGALDAERAKIPKVELPKSFGKGIDDREMNFVVEQASQVTGMPEAVIRQTMKTNPAVGQMILSGAQHSVREAGELGRNIRAKGADVFNVRERGTMIPPDVKEHAQGSIAMGTKVLAELEKSLSPADRKVWKDLVERYRDLQLMQRLNTNLRGGGGTVTGLPAMSGMAIRGGALGAPLGAGLMGLGLINPLAAGGLATTIGLASPANIFRAGSMTGRAADYIPTAVRGERVYEDTTKKPTKLRKR
jgi:hypothetical protein